ARPACDRPAARRRGRRRATPWPPATTRCRRTRCRRGGGLFPPARRGDAPAEAALPQRVVGVPAAGVAAGYALGIGGDTPQLWPRRRPGSVEPQRLDAREQPLVVAARRGPRPGRGARAGAGG